MARVQFFPATDGYFGKSLDGRPAMARVQFLPFAEGGGKRAVGACTAHTSRATEEG